MIYTTPAEISKHILNEILIINPPYKMNHLTTQQLEDLGFEIECSNHCEDFIWQTSKHKKYDVWIETTWKKIRGFRFARNQMPFR